MTCDEYKTLEENDLVTERDCTVARTSPLLECGALFIYSMVDRKGILAHWQDKKIEGGLYKELLQLRLNSPIAVIVGCGLPIECPIEESRTYSEITDFLRRSKTQIREEKVGLDHKLELAVDFFDGSYTIIEGEFECQ